MSYLDRPRITFSGRFYADPSTINNDPNNYEPGVVLQSTNPNAVGYTSWDPGGSAFFRLVECKVTGAIGQGGPVVDPIVGALISTIDSPQPRIAKIVDLDPDQQQVTQLFGVVVTVSLPGNTGSVTGTMQAAELRDLWFQRSLGGGGDRYASGLWQSVLTDLTWSGLDASPVLQQLHATSPDRLSIKFVCDRYDDSASSSSFATGRIAGAIGPAADGEPAQFVMGRRLLPGPGASTNPAPFSVSSDNQLVVIDLGNSLPLQAPGGAAVYSGPLQAVILGPNGPVALATEMIATAETYLQNAWIFEVPLSGDQASLIAGNPLAIAADGQMLLEESPNGLYVNIEPSSLRLNPGETGQATLYGAAFGRPMAGATLALGFDASGIDGTNSPQGALAFDSPVVLDGAGRVVVAISAFQPRPLPAHRSSIGSQVYFLGGPWEAWGQIGANTPSVAALSVLVFDEGPVVTSPMWTANVEPVLAQYAKLYPAMKSRLDLSDHASVAAASGVLKTVLSLPLSDPGHMPVTRDLSKYRREMVLRWIADGCPE